jgi:hypothetical protein
LKRLKYSEPYEYYSVATNCISTQIIATFLSILSILGAFSAGDSSLKTHVSSLAKATLNCQPEKILKSPPGTRRTDLQTAAYSGRTAIHGSLKITPGALVFHRDMIFNIPLLLLASLLATCGS